MVSLPMLNRATAAAWRAYPEVRECEALHVAAIRAGQVGSVEELIDRAENQSVKVVLHGVNVDIYKVLKLIKLAARFSFATNGAGSIELGREENRHAEPTN